MGAPGISRPPVSSNSRMPAIGCITISSTASWPRSAPSSEAWSLARQVSGRADARGLIHRRRDVVEGRLQAGADALHCCNGGYGDQGGDQTIFDRGRALTVPEKLGNELHFRLLRQNIRPGIRNGAVMKFFSRIVAMALTPIAGRQLGDFPFGDPVRRRDAEPGSTPVAPLGDLRSLKLHSR